MQRGGVDSLGPVSVSSRECRGAIDIPGKALRVISRGKQRLTVYRAHQVVLQLRRQQILISGHKKEKFSEFVSSFYM